MSKAPVTSAKAINEAHWAAKSYAEDAVKHALRCGSMLKLAKAGMGHGEFTDWVKTHCEFSLSTAQRYMKAASQKSTGIDFSSLSSLYGSTSKPRKDDSSPGKELAPEAPLELAPVQDTPPPVAALVASDPEPVPESAPTTAPAPAPTTAPTHDPAPDNLKRSDDLLRQDADEDAEPPRPEQDAEELAAEAAVEAEHMASMQRVMESDDRLAAAHAEIKRQAHEIVALQVVRDRFMTEKTEMVRLLQAEQRKTLRLQAQIKKLEGQLKTMMAEQAESEGGVEF